jgi:hypothetical protein
MDFLAHLHLGQFLSLLFILFPPLSSFSPLHHFHSIMAFSFVGRHFLSPESSNNSPKLSRGLLQNTLGHHHPGGIYAASSSASNPSDKESLDWNFSRLIQ